MSNHSLSVSALHFGERHQQILVTGATGFIGQLLVNALLADGHEVVVLTRQPAKAQMLFTGRVKAIAEMNELPVNYRLNIIVNLAGARILGWRWTAARKKILLDSRVALTKKLVDWIARAEHKPELLLSASAIGYYGIQAPGDSAELHESSAPQPIFMSQLCQQWEAEALRAADAGMAVNIMRFGVVLGSKGALPMMLLPIKLGMGGKLGRGDQWFSWIHVQDLLRGIAHLCCKQAETTVAEQGLHSIYNFTAPEAVTQLQFSQHAATLLHRPCLLPTPEFAMRWLLGEQADLLLEGQRVIPHNLCNSEFSFEFPTIKSALADICK